MSQGEDAPYDVVMAVQQRDEQREARSLDTLDAIHQRIAERAAQAADDRAFRAFYERVGRAIYRHHETTGVELKPGLWKIFVSEDMAKALMIYARKIAQPSTALEINRVDPTSGAISRLGGFDILTDPLLRDDQIVIRTEIHA